MVGVGLAFDGLGCTFEKHSYLCPTDFSQTPRDYNGVLAKRLLKTKAVISDFDAKRPVFACFIQKFLEVGLTNAAAA